MYADEQLSRWFDDIFYPAIRQVYDVDRLQHLPESYRHVLATCRALQVEDRLLETPSYRTQLQMSYFLPPQGLQQLWDRILAAVRQPGLQDSRDPELFIEAKGTKLLFKYPDAPSDLLAVMENFDCKLPVHRVLDFSYICSDRLYIDVGKETCPLHNSVSSPEAQTYLWRRCCIRHHLGHLYDGQRWPQFNPQSKFIQFKPAIQSNSAYPQGKAIQFGDHLELDYPSRSLVRLGIDLHIGSMPLQGNYLMRL
ncbi:hypothetical protein B0J13DRAFT_659743 [Dactylonectria estremocensis]|uniref:Uncharacterized protein n=1 Tax=Dactylonectria estremocensis TaxID=1079267 RepID=A0A9P9D2R7_9HYPO|nr:hypothetical protein B0J13DRAFT_659743 [Dactylonectria estremocensis]